MATRQQRIAYLTPAVLIGVGAYTCAVLTRHWVCYVLATVIVVAAVVFSCRTRAAVSGAYGLGIYHAWRSIEEGESVTADGPHNVHPADGLAFVRMVREANHDGD